MHVRTGISLVGLDARTSAYLGRPHNIDISTPSTRMSTLPRFCRLCNNSSTELGSPAWIQCQAKCHRWYHTTCLAKINGTAENGSTHDVFECLDCRRNIFACDVCGYYGTLHVGHETPPTSSVWLVQCAAPGCSSIFHAQHLRRTTTGGGPPICLYHHCGHCRHTTDSSSISNSMDNTLHYSCLYCTKSTHQQCQMGDIHPEFSERPSRKSPSSSSNFNRVNLTKIWTTCRAHSNASVVNEMHFLKTRLRHRLELGELVCFLESGSELLFDQGHFPKTTTGPSSATRACHQWGVVVSTSKKSVVKIQSFSNGAILSCGLSSVLPLGVLLPVSLNMNVQDFGNKRKKKTTSVLVLELALESLLGLFREHVYIELNHTHMMMKMPEEAPSMMISPDLFSSVFERCYNAFHFCIHVMMADQISDVDAIRRHALAQMSKCVEEWTHMTKHGLARVPFAFFEPHPRVDLLRVVGALDVLQKDDLIARPKNLNFIHESSSSVMRRERGSLGYSSPDSLNSSFSSFSSSDDSSSTSSSSSPSSSSRSSNDTYQGENFNSSSPAPPYDHHHHHHVVRSSKNTRPRPTRESFCPLFVQQLKHVTSTKLFGTSRARREEPPKSKKYLFLHPLHQDETSSSSRRAYVPVLLRLLSSQAQDNTRCYINTECCFSLNLFLFPSYQDLTRFCTSQFHAYNVEDPLMTSASEVQLTFAVSTTTEQVTFEDRDDDPKLVRNYHWSIFCMDVQSIYLKSRT